MSQTPKKQLNREGKQQDDEKSSKQRGQPKVSRSAGRPMSEVLYIDSRKSKKRIANAQESGAVAPISLKDAITDCSLRFQNTAGRCAKDNSSGSRSNYRKSRRQRLEISSRTDPPSLRSQRIRKPQTFGKSIPGQISRETMVPLQRNQLLDVNSHNRRLSRRIGEDDHNFYQQAGLLAGSLEELPQEGGNFVPSGRRHSLMEHGKVDDSIRSVYPNFPPTLFGPPPPPPPNIRDFPRPLFPIPGFAPTFGAGIPPGFYLPPQAASGAGAPPGFYLPLQATPGTGMPPGFMPHGFYPPPGFGAIPRFYPPPLITAKNGAPPAIYPLSPVALGTDTSPGSFPRSQSALGTDVPFGFCPPSQAVLGPGIPSTFHPPSQQTSGIPTMLPTSQQSLSREKSDQTSLVPQPTIPLPEPPTSSEIFGSMPSASTSTATTAIPPTLPTESPPQVFMNLFHLILNH